MKFIALDGDDVGHQLEHYILINDIKSLAEFSHTFNRSMKWFVKKMKDELCLEIIFLGGDNVLLETREDEFNIRIIKTLSEDFVRKCGRTLSIGIGQTPRDAYVALKFSKASGKNRISIYDNGRMSNV